MPYRLLPIFLLIPLLTAAQVKIKGSFKQLPEEKWEQAHLSIHYGDEILAVDSAKIDKQGNFDFTLKAPEEGLYLLQFTGKHSAPIVIGKEGELIIQTSIEGLKNGKVHVEGSRENDAYYVLENFNRTFEHKSDSLNAAMEAVPEFDRMRETKMEKLKAEMDKLTGSYNNSLRLLPQMFAGTYAAEVLMKLQLIPQRQDFPQLQKQFDNERSFLHYHFFDYMDFDDPRILSNPILPEKILVYLLNYATHDVQGFEDAVDIIMAKASVNTEVHDYVVSYLLETFTQRGPEELVTYIYETYYSSCEAPLDEEVQFKIEKLEKLKIGKQAPDITVNDFNYQPRSLRETIKGKTGILYFWSTGCPHCLEHTPEVYKIYEKYQDEVAVYAVALDDQYSKWVKTIQDMGLSWMNVSSLQGWKSEAADTYNIRKTPTIIIINDKGEIAAKNVAPFNLEERLKEVM